MGRRARLTGQVPGIGGMCIAAPQYAFIRNRWHYCEKPSRPQADYNRCDMANTSLPGRVETLTRAGS